MEFKKLSIIEPISKLLEEKGYVEPTPIQEKTIPLLLENNDVIGIAQTGTGDLIIQQSIDDKDIILKSDDGGGGMTAYLTLDGSQGFTTVQKKINFQRKSVIPVLKR